MQENTEVSPILTSTFFKISYFGPTTDLFWRCVFAEIQEVNR